MVYGIIRQFLNVLNFLAGCENLVFISFVSTAYSPDIYLSIELTKLTIRRNNNPFNKTNLCGGGDYNSRICSVVEEYCKCG